VPETGHAAADDDEAGVEEADQRGEHLAEPVAAVADERDGDRVTRLGGGADVRGGERAASDAFAASRSASQVERPERAAASASRASAAPPNHASRQPVLPQAQIGTLVVPASSIWMWPMSPAQPVTPR
jgi:hypothetical protein